MYIGSSQVVERRGQDQVERPLGEGQWQDVGCEGERADEADSQT